MRAVCVHLHLYQPPREHPWLGLVEPEPSALPHHDWNARIAAECYRRNAGARLLDGAGLVEDVSDNYARTSWNVVPTLHRWLADEAPEVDVALRAADREVVAPGRGRALGSPAIHAILPLASARDRDTLVAWGVEDFRHRFGRPPEGMWLPEAAVDVPSLETLADHGVRFVLLTPQQAARVRHRRGAWHDVSGERVDPTRPYTVRLPSGRSIAAFFAHGPLSRGIAFDGLLHDGGALASAIRAAFRPDDQPQLVLLATDGETFGHHHAHGEMALARALRLLEDDGAIHVTTPSEHLASYPPVDEVELVEPSSWSCAHGIERWRADCGCTTGSQPGWSQAWRAPLREAVDWLLDALGHVYEQAAAPLLGDPWAARNAYGSVVAGAERGEELVARLAPRPLDEEELRRALSLLELQRNALLATTSCGWFFADPAGIETAIVLRHAGRALDLAREATGIDLEAELVERLAPIRSNEPGSADGRELWAARVGASRVGPAHLAAAAAVVEAAGGQALGRRGDWEVLPDDDPARVRVLHRPTLVETAIEVDATPRGLATTARAHPAADGVPPIELGLPELEADAAAAAATGALGAPGEPRLGLRALARRIGQTTLGEPEAAALAALLAAAAPLEGDAADAAVEALVAARDAALRDPGLAARAAAFAPAARALGVGFAVPTGSVPA